MIIGFELIGWIFIITLAGVVGLMAWVGWDYVELKVLDPFVLKVFKR